VLVIGSIKARTFEGDSGRRPTARHRLMAVSTYRLYDFSVDRLFNIYGVATLTLKRINHNFIASSRGR